MTSGRDLFGPKLGRSVAQWSAAPRAAFDPVEVQVMTARAEHARESEHTNASRPIAKQPGRPKGRKR